MPSCSSTSAIPTSPPRPSRCWSRAPTQEEQIEYARALRVLKAGWTPELRERYFEWFLRAANYRGGDSFGSFVRNIKDDAVATLTEDEKTALADVLAARAGAAAPASAGIAAVRQGVDRRGAGPARRGGPRAAATSTAAARLFGAANCFSCHRFANEGGAVGPDLTGVAGRFSPRDLLESIVEPSKAISDQYQAVIIATDDGRVVTGRIVNLHGDQLLDQHRHARPERAGSVDRREIEEMRPSPVSMMPEGLLDTLEPGGGPRPDGLPPLRRRPRPTRCSRRQRGERQLTVRRNGRGWEIRRGRMACLPPVPRPHEGRRDPHRSHDEVPAPCIASPCSPCSRSPVPRPAGRA